MAVTLRLARKGRKKKPFWHLVATDSRNKRDGSFIELVGFYNPLGDKELSINNALAEKWLAVGASTSPTVRALLRRAGVGAAKVADATAAKA